MARTLSTRRLFINVGFLGAYTTFSSFSLGADLLVRDGYWLPALLYLFLSLMGAFLVVALGDALGQRVIATGRRFALTSRKTRTLTETLGMPVGNEAGGRDHLDIQDDLSCSPTRRKKADQDGEVPEEEKVQSLR
jgi:hypothetical protein